MAIDNVPWPNQPMTWHELRMSSTTSTGPFVPPVAKAIPRKRFKPSDVDWDELCEIYGDDPLLLELFSQMAEHTSSTPLGTGWTPGSYTVTFDGITTSTSPMTWKVEPSATGDSIVLKGTSSTR